MEELVERLTSTKSTEFRWAKSGRVSTLTDDGHLYAKITWARSWGSLATGESGDGRWTFKRVGFLRPRVTVRIEGSQSDLAVIAMEWNGGGDVVFSDASSFKFRRVGFWHPELILADSLANRIFTMTPCSGLRRGSTLKLENEAARSSWRTPLLAMVGWYLSILVAEYDQNVTLLAAAGASGH
ncbi:MAG TPA: hypothetical protein VLY82_00750 [Nitrososphaerales archaeon]|nr:hypothetical protein [Nitrososphaerales archaeon]